MLTVLTNIRLTKVLWNGDDDLRWKTTSKQGRRLRFGMLTVLINIRSTKVSWLVEDKLVERKLLSKVGG